MNTIEEKVSQVINQEPATVEVVVSPKSWLRIVLGKSIRMKVHQPTVKAMCRISAITSKVSYALPEEEGNQLSSIMQAGRDMEQAARIAGILTGGCGLRGAVMGWFFRKHSDISSIARVIHAYQTLLDVSSFFGIITSLRGTSVLTPTREVSQTIPSGPSSEASANTMDGPKRVYVRE